MSDWSSDVCSSDLGYDVDPDPSGEPAHMVDLKPLLTGSVLAHNVEAEQAVEDSAVEPAAETLVPVDEADSFEAEVPEVVRKQEDLADRVAAVSRAARALSGRRKARSRAFAAFSSRTICQAPACFTPRRRVPRTSTISPMR